MSCCALTGVHGGTRDIFGRLDGAGKEKKLVETVGSEFVGRGRDINEKGEMVSCVDCL